METAVVAAGKAVIVPYRGGGTSTEAEWLALIDALTIAQSLGTADFVLLGASAEVVAKANGSVPCRGSCTQNLERFRAISIGGHRPRVRYIKRSQNLAGIALAKRYPR